MGGSAAIAVYALQFAVGVLVQVALARRLSPEAFGRFAIAILGLNLILTLGNIHADRFAIAQADDFEKGIGAGISAELLWMALLVGLGLLVLPVLPAVGLDPSIVVPTQILLLGALTAPFSRIRAAMERELSFVRARLPSLAAQVLGGGIGLMTAPVWGGLAPLVTWKLSVLSIEAASLWWAAPGRFRFTLDWDTTKSILRFGTPLMGAAVLTYVYNHADYYIVATFMTEEDLGAYFFAFQATALTLAVRTALNSILLSIWAGTRSNPQAVTDSYPVMVCAITIVYMVPTTILFGFSPAIVDLLLGPEWLRLGELLPPLMLLASLRAVAAIWDPIVMMGDMTSVLLRVTVARVLLAPLAIILGVLTIGVVGAALGALLAYVVTLPIISTGVATRYMLPYGRVLRLWGLYGAGLAMTLGARFFGLDPIVVLGLVASVNLAGAVAVRRWFGRTLAKAFAR